MKPELTLCGRWFKKLYVEKVLACSLSFVFLFSQVIPVTFANTPTAGEFYAQQAEKTLEEIQAELAKEVPPPDYNTSQDFLLNAASPLTKVNQDEVQVRDAEAYSFEEALEYLTPDYAAAVIVDGPITANNIKDLVEKLNIEVGLVVIERKLVLFTSGNKEQIRVNPAVMGLVAEHASLVAHTQPAGLGVLPSLTDYAQAGANEEYVATTAGVFGYNQDGLTTDLPYDYEYLADKINNLVDNEASSKAARDILNNFIVQIDLYNEDPENYEVFRSGPATVLPNEPTLGDFANNATFTANQTSSSEFTMNYDLTTDPSFGGAIISWGINPADLSGIGTFVFDMRTDNNCVASDCLKIEFVDVDGDIAVFFVQGLTSSFSQVDVTAAALISDNPLIDLDLITQINFVIDNTMVATQAIGFVDVITGGLAFDPDISPDPSLNAGDITTLPLLADGSRPAPQGFASAGSTSDVVVSTSTFGFVNYGGADPGAFGGFFIDYGAGLINMNTAFPSGIVLGLDSANTDSVIVELTDNNGNRDKVTLVGLTPSRQHYRINLTDFTGIDLGNIQTIAFVFEGDGARNLNFDWGIFEFTEPIFPDGGLGVETITKLPLLASGQRPPLGEFSFGATTTLNQTSPTFAQFTYDGSTAGSFGGVAISYGAETFNFNTAFPTGLILGAESPSAPGVSTVLVEITDGDGNRDSVELRDLQTFGQRYLIEGNKFFGIDLTRVQTISFVFEGAGIKTLNIDWGNFEFTEPVFPDGGLGVNDITKLPLLNGTDNASINAFAAADGTTSGVTLASQSFATVDYNGNNVDSFGGAFIDFSSDPLNFTTQYPTGLIIGLESPDVTTVLVELTDINGVRDTVEIRDMENFGKRYRIEENKFFGLDMTQIVTMSFVFNGAGVKTLKVDWGDFDFTPILAPDGALGPGDVTVLPPLSDNSRPQVAGFGASGGDTVVTLASKSFATLAYTGTDADSFGGAIISYGAESIDFTALYPSGLIIGVESPNATDIFFEVTDTNGVTDRVQLSSLQNFGQFYRIESTVLPNLDLTSVQSFAFIFEGASAQTISMDWGNFDFTEVIGPDPTKGEGDITALPLLSTGERVPLVSFAGGTGTASVTVANNKFANLSYSATDATGFGGAFLTYDDPVTTGVVETFDFNAAFPSGIVLQLDSPNSTSVVFELTDITGAKDTVVLDQVANFGQRWLIPASAFAGLDMSQIQTIAFVFEGTGPNDLVIRWEDFEGPVEIGFDPALDESDVTPLPLLSNGDRVAINAFAPLDGTVATITNLGENFATLNYDGFDSESFGGAFLAYDDPDTVGTIETFNFNTAFPTGLVLQMDSPNATSVLFEIEDITGKKDTVLLSGIANFGQRWLITAGSFLNMDMTQIKTMSFVFLGADPATLNIVSGPFDGTRDIGFTPGLNDGDVTQLPLLGNGSRVVPGAFAELDGSTATITNQSDTFISYNYNGTAATSFGGVFFAYDDEATVGVTEVFNFETQFPTGMVIRVDSPDSSASTLIVELTDINGDTDTVRLVGIENFGQYYVIQATDFFGIDTTQIQTVSLVNLGNVNETLNVFQGLYDATAEISFTPGLNDGDVTQLPLLGNGERVGVGAFASLDGSTSVVNNQSDTFVGFTYTGTTADPASFGGLFFAYDDEATVGTIETFDFTSTFPTGMVIRVDSPDSSAGDVLVELTDINGVTDTVKLISIANFGQYYVIPGSAFFGLDLTQIQTMSLVFTGTGTKTLNLFQGEYDATKEISFEGGLDDSDVTQLPLLASGGRVNVGAFAELDGSTTTITNQSDTFVAVTYNGTAATSFGGLAFAYDDETTAGVTEVFNFETEFPGGMVIRVDSPAGAGNINNVLVELTDITGKQDTVRLISVDTFGQYYRILASDFFNLDTTQIQTMAIVFEGAGQQTLNLFQGLYDATAEISFTPGLNDGDVTQLPLLGNGERVGVGAFASLDGSTSVVNNQSDTFVGFTYTGTTADPASFGGLFFAYDDEATVGTIETFDFTSTFPTGMVIRVDSPDSSAGDVLVELTDINGVTDTVKLISIANFGQYYVIPGSAFFGLDLTQIQTMSLVFTGTGTKTLNLFQGEYDATKEISFEGGLDDSDVTQLPLLASGGRVNVGAFAELDGSTTTITNQSDTFVAVTYNGTAATSFGGLAFAYDDETTAGVTEVFNFETEFPGGMVIRVDSPAGAGNINNVLVELTDITGKQDTVRLISVDTFGQYYRILASDFFNLDTTQIQTMAIVFEGAGQQTLNLFQGLYDATAEISFTPGLNDGDVTQLPLLGNGERVGVGAFASLDGSTSVVNNQSDTFVGFTYTGTTADPASFGGLFFAYDDEATVGTIETFDFTSTFPTGMVIRVDSPDSSAGDVLVELTDINGVTDTVKLISIANFGQYYVIPGSAFFGLDLTQIQTMSLVFTGTGTKTLNLFQGEYDATKEISFEGGLDDSDVTQLPLLGNGGRVNVGAFAELDGSTTTITNQSDTFVAVTYNGTAATSFGGLAFAYDDETTAGVTEVFNFETEFPGGMVIRVDSPAGAGNINNVLVELTDITGKQDTVRLISVDTFGQYYRILASDFFNLDTTQIQTMAIVFEGAGQQTLNLFQGLYDATAEISFTPGLNDGDVTQLPLLGNGERVGVGAFASLDGSTSVVNNQSDTFVGFTYTGTTADPASFGGLFFAYDDEATVGTIETFDFTSTFPTGMVIRVDSPDSSAGDVLVELTDINGVTDTVKLISIANFGQYYVIPGSAFFGLDLTQIQTMSLVFTGTGTKTLNLFQGEYDATKEISFEGGLDDSDVTQLPLLGNGGRVNVGAFAELDGSTTTITNQSDTFVAVTYNGTAATSFGGLAFAYDDETTAGVTEVFNFETEFPGGMVIRVDSPAGAGNINNVLVELTDITGKQDTVRLISVDTFGQYYRILASDFFNLDTTQIQTMAIVFEGAGQQTLNLFQGLYDATAEISFTPGLNDGDVTQLPLLGNGERVGVGAFASLDGSTSVVNNQSDTFVGFTYTGTTADPASFGGLFFAYDDEATVGTIETFDFTSTFPTGMVIRVDSPDSSAGDVLVELTDINGVTDTVKLISIANFGQYYVIPGSAFFGLDLTQIQTMSLVFTGTGTKTLNLFQGEYDATKEISFEGGLDDSDVTQLPLLGNGGRVNVGAFAELDGSTTTITNQSDTFVAVTYNGTAATSFGGLAFAYDDETTAGVTEVFNFETEFPGGMVIRVDSPAGAGNINNVLVELTDITGKQDTVRLISVDTFGQYYRILASDFFNLDTTQIQTMAIVFEGAGQQTLNLFQGLYDATAEISFTPGLNDGDVTQLPLLGNGERVGVGAFASLDGSTSVVNNQSDTFVGFTYTGTTADPASFGGLFFAYDDEATVGTIETFDFTSTFPTGMVIRVDSPDSSAGDVLVELTDINGVTDTVKLISIANFGQYYVIPGSAFFGLDLTQIQTMSLVFTGVGTKTLNLFQGEYDATKEISFEGGLDDSDVTQLPLLGNGGRVNVGAFAELDGSTTTITNQSDTFVAVTYNGTAATSFGGLAFAYDDETTAGVTEVFNFETEFPGGMVIRVDSPAGAGNINNVLVELTDITGKQDTVRLISVDTFGQYYRILASDFFNLDTTQIQTMAIVFEGAGQQTLNLFQGLYDATAEISFTPGLNDGDVTQLPLLGNGERVGVGAFASLDGSTSVVNNQSDTFVGFTYTGTTADPASFGGLFFAYDDEATVGTIETFDFTSTFPTGMVIRVDSPDSSAGDVLVELTDINGVTDTVKLISIANFGQYYVIPGSAFFGLDLTQIQTMSLVFTGVGTKTLNLFQGEYDATKEISFEGGLDDSDVTQLPLLGNGGRVNVGAFAELDGSTTTITNQSDTFVAVTYNGTAATSFGGLAFAYDDETTAGVTEVFNFETEFPGGMVIRVDSPAGAGNINNVLVELTDITGKQDTVRLISVDTFGQYYRILASDFFNLDTTQIQTMAIVFEGAGQQTLNLFQGLYDATAEISFTPGLNDGDVTQLPLLGNGERVGVGAFASLDGSTSVVNNQSDTFVGFTYTGTTADPASFGGLFFAYDDEATVGTIETFDFTSTFPTGMVIRVDSPDSSAGDVLVELTDINGVTDTVKLISIANFGQYYVIPGSAFFGLDLTQIQTMSLVFTGVGTKTLNLFQGEYDATKEISFEGGLDDSDVTQLPLLGNGGRVNVGAFAELDGSTTTITNQSDTFVAVTYNGTAATSFGGLAFAYDDETTAGVTEVFNFETEFPGGMVIRVDSPAGAGNINNVLVELTDITGKQDTVRLISVDTFGQYYRILASDFFNLDTTQIQTMAIVFEGAGQQTLNLFQGLYDATAEISFTPGLNDGDVTQLPLLGNGERVGVGAFASLDGSTSVVNNQSDTFVGFTYTGTTADPASFGGLFFAYDDEATVGTIETFDFTSTFPTGMVIRVDSPDSSAGDVLVELTDINGVTDTVKLISIANFGQYYVIPGSAFFGLDLTQIQTMSLVFTGVGTKTLNLFQGEYDATKEISFEGGLDDSDVTQLPLLGNGGRVNVGAFAELDGSTTTITNQSDTFVAVTYNGTAATSFGGLAFAYDDETTAGVTEVFNFETEFPGGMVIRVDSPAGAGNINNVLVELTDITGKQDTVRLISVDTFGQYYRILASDFFNLDTTQIQTMAIVFEGAGQQTLNLFQGLYDATAEISFTPGLNDGDVTQLPLLGNGERVGVGAFASLDGSTSVVNNQSDTFVGFTYTGTTADPASFGGLFFAYDDEATVGTIETFDFTSTFPTGMVIRVDSPDSSAGDVLVELTDINGVTDTVKLISIANFGQYYVIPGSAFFGLDLTQIQTMSLVFTGVGTKTLNLFQGEYDATKEISFEGGLDDSDVTQLPLLGNGGRVNVGAFAELDGSTTTITNQSDTFVAVTYNGTAATSFGGLAFAYDDETTAGVTEVFNFETEFPGGMVIRVDSPAGAGNINNVLVELTDITGKQDTVRLISVDTFGQYYRILASDFFNLDTTQIQTMAIVFEGAGQQTLNLFQGLYDATAEISFTPGLNDGDVTQLPLLGNGERVGVERLPRLMDLRLS